MVRDGRLPPKIGRKQGYVFSVLPFSCAGVLAREIRQEREVIQTVMEKVKLSVLIGDM